MAAAGARHRRFAGQNDLSLGQNHLAGVDVLRTHLPGNHCPSLVAVGVGTWGRASGAGQIVAYSDPMLIIEVLRAAVAACGGR